MSPSDVPAVSSSARAPQAHALRPGELLRIPDDTGALLAVVRGRVWLTRANDADDHFLDAGRTLRIEPGALALLSAEGGAAEVLVYRDAPARDRPPSAARAQPPRTIGASPASLMPHR